LHKIYQVVFDPLSLLGKVLSARYQVQDLIDGGGRAFLYKVFDKIEEKEKAIKLFPPQFSFIKGGFSEIINELTLARDITHRNVVRVYGLERDEDLNFIIMEYIDGYNLKQKLEVESRKKLGEELALYFMKQAASGLMEAHKKGIIHRNLSDQNIMITAAENTIKIINFGLSKKIRKSISEITGELYGRKSLLYIPPEQFEKSLAEENEQTDVWAFGAVLYQLLTGKPPFAEDNLTRDPGSLPSIPGISERINDVMMKCLERDRRKRYRNAQEIYNALPGDTEKIAVQEKKPIKKVGAMRKWIFPLALGIIAAAILVIAGIKIFKGGDTYRMWYSGNPGDGKTPGGGIGYAVSTDGVDWERSPSNPVIPQGANGTFNEFESTLPYVVSDGKNFYMLFRAGKSSGDMITYSVGYAESPDGSIWDKDKVKNLNDKNIKSPGPILYIDGYYKMWYPDNGEVYYACTKNRGASISNLATYQTDPVVKKGNAGEWDENEITAGTVLFESGVYKMWYTGKSGAETKIGYAVSASGINWDKHLSPVFDDKEITNEMNPVIIHDSEGFKMYYTAATGGRDYSPVLLAVSTDGIKWQKYSNIPVFDTGSEDWEKTKVFATAVVINKKR
ncbi:MAG: protein kinase, partial [Candidatus Aminicenantes bacterium]|nr:protein kinase [Candidatus Aminicenantes bacterium]